MDFPWGTLASIVWTLVGRPLFDQAAPPPAVPTPAPTLLAVMEQITHRPVPLPAWVLHTPENCFVGISPLCPSQAEARDQAVASAVAQVLQAMGAEYRLRGEARSQGTASQASHEIKEELVYTARWLLREVQQGLRQTIIQEHAGKYLAYVLLEAKPEQLERMRRLTMGPKLSARLLRNEGDSVIIEVRESAGVAVTLMGYRLSAETRHEHARLITLFAFKVAESSHWDKESGLPSPLRLRNSAAAESFTRPSQEASFKALALGSHTSQTFTLTGYDEIGRPVSIVASLP